MSDGAEWRQLAGVMCGTSGDGVSVAIVETRGWGRDREVRVLGHLLVGYPPDLKERLFALFPPQRFTAEQLAHLHRDMGELLAAAVLEATERSGVDPSGLAAIVLQAPTLYHEGSASAGSGASPDSDPIGPTQGIGVHMEVGEAAIVAERTGVPVVCDLRPSDVAAGGQGAPLSAYVDYVLFADDRRGRAVQNIGGIANVTFLPRGTDLDGVRSFDTGPGNMVIDAVVQALTGGREAFDRDGQLAAAGRVQDGLLAELLRHPYLALPLPKTTGREDFGAPLVARVLRRAEELGVRGPDLVATVTALTAESIAMHYRRELQPGALDEVILYGGGAHNPTLVGMVRERVAPLPLRLHEEFGIPGDAREALTWAVLGDETLASRPGNVPAASGARRRVVLGKVTSPTPGRAPWRDC